VSGLSNPYAPPTYQHPYQAPAPDKPDPVDWRAELRILVLVTAFSALLGEAVGLIWHALAPTVGIVAAAEGSSAATKALIGDDLWLALLGIVAGVVCVALLLVVAPDAARGPGATVGLAVGGVLGSIVAARVGHLVGHHDLTGVLHASLPHVSGKIDRLILHYFDFTVRAKPVLLGWPFVAILLNTLIVALRKTNRSVPVYAYTYPGYP
jgi:hypothetical protein